MAISQHTRNPNAKLAMQRAWGLARERRALYGGNVHDHYPAALKQAWNEIKSDPVVQEVAKILAENKARRAKQAQGGASPMATYHRRSYAGVAGR